MSSGSEAQFGTPSGTRPPMARTPNPRARVWSIQTSLRDGAEWIDCDVLSRGADGWECVLLKNGAWFYGGRFPTHGEAESEAEEWRTRYLVEGAAVVG